MFFAWFCFRLFLSARLPWRNLFAPANRQNRSLQSMHRKGRRKIKESMRSKMFRRWDLRTSLALHLGHFILARTFSERSVDGEGLNLRGRRERGESDKPPPEGYLSLEGYQSEFSKGNEIFGGGCGANSHLPIAHVRRECYILCRME